MKNEIWSWIGDLSQVAGIKHYELRSGRAKGTEAFDVRTGAGLAFTVVKDRALDIAWAVDLKALGEFTITLDCDVLQADGGTRTASITGACVALADALQKLVENGKLKTNPMKGMVAAVSVGIVNGEAVCDLEYVEDSAAETDMNVVMTEDGRIIEVQGTAEGEPFTHEELLTLLALARGGIESIVATQKAALAN